MGAPESSGDGGAFVTTRQREPWELEGKAAVKVGTRVSGVVRVRAESPGAALDFICEQRYRCSTINESSSWHPCPCPQRPQALLTSPPSDALIADATPLFRQRGCPARGAWTCKHTRGGAHTQGWDLRCDVGLRRAGSLASSSCCCYFLSCCCCCFSLADAAAFP